MNEMILRVDQLPAIAETSALNGSQGTNRGRGAQQIAAANDLEAVRMWLAEFLESPHTCRSYAKEVSRLLNWATGILRKPLSSLTREDLFLYEEFLKNPGDRWTDLNLPRFGLRHRLINGPLSDRSIRQSFSVLSSLFGYLVSAGYLAGNPISLRRTRRSRNTRQPAAQERYLDHALWNYLLEFIETLPQDTESGKRHYERARWLFRLLYGTALRVSEAAQSTTGDLMQRHGKWWLHVVGKGKSEGNVPVSDELMADLGRYRQFNGLSAVPGPLESTPLVLSVSGKGGKSLTPTAIYLVVKEVFRRAADAREAGDPAGARILRSASTHWMRHTSATHQADAGNDLRFIRMNLRHASLDTTGIYLHAEEDQRHEATTSNKWGE